MLVDGLTWAILLGFNNGWSLVEILKLTFDNLLGPIHRSEWLWRLQTCDCDYNKHRMQNDLHNFENLNAKSFLIFAWQLKSVQIHFLSGLDSFVNTNCVIWYHLKRLKKVLLVIWVVMHFDQSLCRKKKTIKPIHVVYHKVCFITKHVFQIQALTLLSQFGGQFIFVFN